MVRGFQAYGCVVYIFYILGTIEHWQPTGTWWPTAEHLHMECFSLRTDPFELRLAQTTWAEQAGDWKAWAEFQISGLDWGHALNDMSSRTKTYTGAAQKARNRGFQWAVEVS